jgi:diguanylate cyclase
MAARSGADNRRRGVRRAQLVVRTADTDGVRISPTAAAVPAAAVLALGAAELVGAPGAVVAVAAASVAGGVIAAVRDRPETARQPAEIPTGGARDLLHRRLEELLSGVSDDQRLVMVAIEGVAEIDDALGHEVGDAVLAVVEQRLRAVVRREDLVARLRGDDFALLVSRPSDDRFVDRLGRRIRASVREPCEVEGLSLLVDARVTSALIPAGTRSVGEALQAATAALRGARGTHPPLGSRHASPLRRLDELRRSLEQDHLVVHYQPKIDLLTGRVRGAEALVRWEHPVEGMLMPASFVPAAEHCGVGRDLTLRVLEVALHQCAAWALVGWHLELSVNVAPAALFDQRLPEDVARLLGAAGIAPELLILEIPEPLVMQDHAGVRQAAGALRGMGVRLSVDDYGTATSTMSHLAALGICELKLDGALVAGLGRDAGIAERVRAAVHVAHGLGVELVAEGVEDRPSWELLRDAGCDLAQGYYLSRPLPSALFGIWLRTQPVVGRLSRP